MSDGVILRYLYSSMAEALSFEELVLNQRVRFSLTVIGHVVHYLRSTPPHHFILLWGSKSTFDKNDL